MNLTCPRSETLVKQCSSFDFSFLDVGDDIKIFSDFCSEYHCSDEYVCIIPSKSHFVTALSPYSSRMSNWLRSMKTTLVSSSF